MDQSLMGHLLPESKDEYELLMAAGDLYYKVCCFCGKSHLNRTYTKMAWRETQISGSCEDCWNEMFKDIED